MQPIIRVASEAEFLNAPPGEYPFLISIQGRERYPGVLRPDYPAKRLNLYFEDAVTGEGLATREDMDKLYRFALLWRREARRDSASARLIVHCLAGVSRSAAAAMMPLALWYGNFEEAARALFKGNPSYLRPNTYILHLIEERLYPGHGRNIFESVLTYTD